MGDIRIHEKPNAVPNNAAVFAIEMEVGGVWYTRKVTWEQLTGLIAALNNLQNYYLKTETYTKTEVNQLIAAIPTFTIEIVEELPTTDISTSTLYLVPKQTAGSLDYYDEFINLDGTTSGWEWLGKTEIDLSNYYTKSETEAYVKGDGADYIVGTKTYSTLTTTAKAVIDAINEVKQTADGAQTDATRALADASAAQGTANSASSAASAAQGTADTALTTAQGAASAASTAQGTANTALTTAQSMAVSVTNTLTPGDTTKKVADVTQNSTTTPIYADDAEKVVVALTDEQTTAPGNPVTLTTEQSGGAKSALVEFTPKQSGSGDPSPSNVRPISGWDSLSLNRCEEKYAELWSIDTNFNGYVNFNQLVNKSKFINITQSDYTVVDNGDGSLTVTIINTLASAINVLLTANTGSSYVKLPRSHKYILLDNNILPTGVVYRNGYNAQSIGVNVIKAQTASLDYFLMSVTLPSGLTAQTFTLKPNIIDLTQMFGSTIADYIYSLEQATPGSGVEFFRNLYPSDYYDYNEGTQEMVGANIATATFDTPIYGGNYDFVRGEGQNIWYFREFEGGQNENWAVSGSGTSLQRFLLTLDKILTNPEYAISNYLIRVEGSVGEFGEFNISVGQQTSNSILVFKDKSNVFSDVTALKTYLSTHKLQIACPLFVPTEIELTAEQIELLKGSNTVWSDANGNVTVEYAKIPNGNLGAVVEYIKKLEARIAALES